jgi:hypothetical protein
MSDTAPNNASRSESRIIDERVQGAPGRSSRPRPKNGWVDDATAATGAAADAGCRATKSVSRQIEGPLMVALVGFALGYLASLWIRKEGGRPARIDDDKANIKVPSP